MEEREKEDKEAERRRWSDGSEDRGEAGESKGGDAMEPMERVSVYVCSCTRACVRVAYMCASCVLCCVYKRIWARACKRACIHLVWPRVFVSDPCARA